MIQRNKNRHLVVVLDDQTTIDLRPPNVEEWALIVEFYEAADAAVRLAVEQVDPAYTESAKTAEEAAHVLVNRATWGSSTNPAPYASALADTITLLSPTRIDAGKLPMWACRNTFGVLHQHWTQVEITVEGTAALPSEPAAPWTESDDPDEMPTIDIDKLAAVPPANAPTGETAVGGLRAGTPTAAAV